MSIIKHFESERNTSFWESALLNYLIQGLNIVLNLLLIPLLIKVLGKESFGIWQTLLSIISFATLLNFGLGNGLRNLITQLSANHLNQEIGYAIGATVLKTIKIAAFVSFILFPTLYFFLDTDFLFSNSNTAEDQIKISLWVFLFFFVVNLVLSLSASISYGLQKSYLTGFAQFIYLLSAYAIILIANNSYALNLVHIAFIFGITQSVSYVLLFFYQIKQYQLSITYDSSYNIDKMLKTSYQFFTVQFLSIVFLSVDNFIISASLGPSQTTEYSIVNKIYFTLINLFSILLIQFWNSVTDAFVKGELLWIKKTSRYLYLIAILLLIIGILISVFKDELLHFWLGEGIFYISQPTFYLFTTYMFLHCINAIFVNIQNGMGQLKIQIISNILAISIYAAGCLLIDISTKGYNYLIAFKICAMFAALLLNSLILKKLKSV